MIQVIGRVATIMGKLSAEDDLSLPQLCGDSGLNHATVCNILRSLIEIGWIEKNGRGQYRISAAFREMGNKPEWDETLTSYFQTTIQKLSQKIKETVVISTLRYTKILIIAQATYQHALMVNDERLYAKLSLYTSVSGEVLCAGLTAQERKDLYCIRPPMEQDLKDDGGTIEGYEKKMERIRHDGVSISANSHLGIKSWALPIYDKAGRICACLGLSVPFTRLPEDGGEGILQHLKETTQDITQWIAKQGFSSRNLIRLAIN